MQDDAAMVEWTPKTSKEECGCEAGLPQEDAQREDAQKTNHQTLKLGEGDPHTEDIISNAQNGHRLEKGIF